MVIVVLLFLGCVIHALWGIHHDHRDFFYAPLLTSLDNLNRSSIFAGTSVAVKLTTSGFDAVSTYRRK